MPPFRSAWSPAKRNWRRFGSRSKILSKKFTRHGILFLISAPSGAGKTTLVEALRKNRHLFYSVSCTTRAPRDCEVNGEHYQFLSAADCHAQMEAGDCLDHAQVHEDLYGT